MKLSELHRIVNLLHKPDHYIDPEVTVVIKLPYATIGAHPMVTIKNASMGFDWEAGKFMLWPDENLTYLDTDFKKKFSDMQTKCGGLEYENRYLKSEIKRLRKEG